MMGIARTIGMKVAHGELEVATVITVLSGHVVEANGDELMGLVGRARRGGEIAGRSTGSALIRVNERQGIASILGSLSRVMLQPTPT